jgi:Protein of unknown function (DUF1592)/Protein of unknown function (DUF1588)/Protein of unknown function (DUF1585)/Protein of unknown function (DUF1587)/Protein of unknown function (DUF1595)/Planctomycete cytochrome C
MRRLLVSVIAFGMALPVVLPAAAQAKADAHTLISERCTGCHNATDWAGGLALDTLELDNLKENAEVLEKMVRKMRGRLMPPPGEEQPKQQDIDSVVAELESKLDAHVAQNPNPGSVGLHRLNRKEYARIVEEMFDIRVDATTLLPRDVSSDGFDNVATMLRTSPAFLEQYVAAARRVSRQAVARPPGKPSTHAYRHDRTDQRQWIPGLPLGTRGGMVVEHFFPADGDYQFSITDFHFGGAGYINRLDAPHRVILTIDDQRVFEQVVGGPEDLKLVDQTQAFGEAQLQVRFNNIRIHVKAGVRRVGATFVARSMAESDSQLRPIAMLPEMERFPEIPGLEIDGPFTVTGPAQTESRRRIFTCRPTVAAEEEACAEQILGRLARQAYRRPIEGEDLKAPLKFYRAARRVGDFDTGIEAGITALLTSTDFLFRNASGVQGEATPAVVPLNDLELASRLSFFLWSQGPDEALLNIAAAGKLKAGAELERQVERMLADPRAGSLITNFAFQWLNVAKLDDVIPDPIFYPEFDAALREGFREELRLFLDSILRADRSVVDLLTADHSFLNEKLAKHYDIPGVTGGRFRRVTLPASPRFGLLGKGAVLMGTAYGHRTAPVLRGAWIMESISGTPPTAPPPGVETLVDTPPGAPIQTMRERMEAHRMQKSCNSCHGVMDPLGFALENFDVVGAWRNKDRDAGTLIDASGTLADGRPLSGPDALRTVLAGNPTQFVQTLTERLMIFALGRGIEHYDMPTVRQIVRSAEPQGFRFGAIVKGIVNSYAFQNESLIEAKETATPKVAQHL